MNIVTYLAEPATLPDSSKLAVRAKSSRALGHARQHT